MTADQERLALSRLYSRFTFGAKAGQFEEALKNGFDATKNSLLVKPTIDEINVDVLPLTIDDLGPRPTPGTFESTEYSLKIREQNRNLVVWWLDQMVTSDYQLNEKMTWFWHGHWATSIEKLNFALPMYKQNKTLRFNALSHFGQFAKLMYEDGALQFWLDGQENTAAAPNENLSREFMELFTLGVGRYLEDDVKALARIFTGMQVQRTNGLVFFNPRRHDSSPVTLLGTTKVFTAQDAIDSIISRDDSSRFIYERIWYRFFSSTTAMPEGIGRGAFESRDIFSAISDLVSSSFMYASDLQMVKSPVEWFIGTCRALSVIPSSTKNISSLLNDLQRLSQLPFVPPNVGGWPAGEMWLTSASAQFRLSLTQNILKNIDFGFLERVAPALRVNYLMNLLGVYRWSQRTSDSLTVARQEPARMLLLALNSPEYLVGA